MDKMIVGMNYTQDGNRTIALINYYYECSIEYLNHLLEDYVESYDEVYIVSFDPNCVDFINEIVLKGCRVWYIF